MSEPVADAGDKVVELPRPGLARRGPDLVAIVNPASGDGAIESRWPAVEDVLRARFDRVRVRATAGPGDATALTRAALEAGDAAAAAG